MNCTLCIFFIIYPQSMTTYHFFINGTLDKQQNDVIEPGETTLLINTTAINKLTNNSELSYETDTNNNSNDESNDMGLRNVLGTATLLVSVLTIIGNGSLLWVILKTSQLRTITNSFIVSLAISDLIIGLLVMPFYAGKIHQKGLSVCNIQLTSLI